MLITNMRIHKYTLVVGLNNLELPLSAKILDVQAQHGEPVLWALVDLREEMRVTRNVVLVPTGVQLQADVREWSYLGTVQLAGGSLVFHAFLLD